MKYCTDEACTVCGAHTEGGNDLHHVKTRGAGGTDHPWNLMPLCNLHHRELHNSGLITFSKRFKNVHSWLVVRDWCICELTGKWYHSKEATDDNRQTADEDSQGSETH
jgi:hypothetical protein